MNNPLNFYQDQLVELEKKFTALKKLSIQVSIIRFIIFIGTGFLGYYFFDNTVLLLICLFIGISVFIFLIVKHVNLKRRKDIVSSKIKINTTEISVLNGDFKDLETGIEFKDPKHFFSNDIDLFGKGSFYQFINRTATKDGKKELAKLLLANNTSDILDRQEVIKELSKKILWRQHFSAIASLVTVKNDSQVIVDWMMNYKLKFSKNSYYLTRIFSAISIVLVGLLIAKLIPFFVIVTWFFLGLFISGRFLKTTQQLYNETDKVREIFKQYHLLLNEIESVSFKSKNLLSRQETIQSENKKASHIFKQFSKILDAFDQRNNIIIAVFGNGLFLSELFNASRTENWISTYKHTVQKWFEVITFFDAYNSLGNYGFNHKQFAYPKIVKGNDTILAQDLGHPLLKLDKRIDSDLDVQREQFFIVTGANMAGKSTFLRTVALHIVMANVGLPVCAKESQYRPIKLITSMRTTDSLTDDSSYFFSELTRLKFVVDTVENDSNYFIILDEILKGTNSTDKAIGSRKFVEKLVKLNATGIIATHDLSLTEIESELEAVKNYFFDAQIINNELYFDYKLKEGKF